MARAAYAGPNTPELTSWFAASDDWIATLKPKPTTRRSKSN